jgi:hypothetical protein
MTVKVKEAATGFQDPQHTAGVPLLVSGLKR